MYYNSNTLMSKYLVNSSTKPEINGYYINTGNEMMNGQLIYKKDNDSQYRLYYDNIKLTWNIGLKSKTPLVSAHQGIDITDPYKANWNMIIIIVKLYFK